MGLLVSSSLECQILKCFLLMTRRIVAMVVGSCFVLVFLFVPETFWDRTPRPHKSRRTTFGNLSKVFSNLHHDHEKGVLSTGGDGAMDTRRLAFGHSTSGTASATIAERRQQRRAQHVGFADQARGSESGTDLGENEKGSEGPEKADDAFMRSMKPAAGEPMYITKAIPRPMSPASHNDAARVVPHGEGPQTPDLHHFNSPFYLANEKPGTDYMKNEQEKPQEALGTPGSAKSELSSLALGGPQYTHYLRTQPPKTYVQTLKPWNGRLRDEKWLLVAFRPFILFTYPSILWSALVYSLSIGWLIVLSESISSIYENKESYNFTALQAGLVYVSAFIGGVLGTAVAGKFSDVIVRFMARRNGGIYEPEFRLVMAIPVTIATCIGLMGFGWSAQARDNWIVPTVFFGIISFGCALGSTTAITFAVDSYRQYAGEALVTLNFSKSKSGPFRHSRLMC